MIEDKDLLNKLNKEEFVVCEIHGTSMFPLLKQGRDKVIITKLQDTLNKYDVVLYKAKNAFVLHRIIDIKDKELIIRGDNCINKEYINTDNVIGILKAIYRKGKYIEVNKKINKKYYLLSNSTYLFRKLISKI